MFCVICAFSKRVYTSLRLNFIIGLLLVQVYIIYVSVLLCVKLTCTYVYLYMFVYIAIQYNVMILIYVCLHSNTIQCNDCNDSHCLFSSMIFLCISSLEINFHSKLYYPVLVHFLS